MRLPSGKVLFVHQDRFLKLCSQRLLAGCNNKLTEYTF